MLISEKACEWGINCVNWPDQWPYRPEVSLEARHDGDNLYLHYKVREDAVMASAASDREQVWRDSCVEFFFAPADDGLYYNIECSCIGKIYMCCGGDRHDREFLPEEAYRGIIREGSLGMEPFALREGPLEWEMRLVIPASTFVRHDIRSFRGLEARGNFYKCEDALPQRHYLSLFPVATLKPDFHRPEFFDKIIFSK